VERRAEVEQALAEYEEGRAMPYVTSIERHGIEKGLLQGLQEAVIQALETRFGSVPEPLRQTV
jgi:hypothetical protein